MTEDSNNTKTLPYALYPPAFFDDQLLRYFMHLRTLTANTEGLPDTDLTICQPVQSAVALRPSGVQV
jgi:hypothetical protein